MRARLRCSSLRCRSSLCWALLLGLLGAGCDGPQSSLSPAGRDAQEIRDLFLWMTAFGALIWVGVALIVTRAGAARNPTSA